MKKFFTVLFLMLLMGAAANGYVWMGYTWEPFGGHWYAPTKTIGNWDAVLSEALGFSGAEAHLVTINSLAENAWLTTTFDGMEPTGVASVGAWTGLEWISGDKHLSTSWAWESGESGIFIDTYDAFGDPEAGTHMYLHTASHVPQPGTWNYNLQHDEDEGKWLHGIIEIPVVIPAPSAIVLGGIGIFLFGLVRRHLAR